MPAHLCIGCIINSNQGGGPKKCGTATGVGVINRSNRMPNMTGVNKPRMPNMTGVNKPRITNYTYESLQRALYPGRTVAVMNDLFDAPVERDMMDASTIDSNNNGWIASSPLGQNIKCKTVTLNNKITVPTNKTLYIPKCVILNILQSGTLINNKDKDAGYKGIVNRGTINNKGKIYNRNSKIDNHHGLLDNHDGVLDNQYGLLDNLYGLLDNRRGKLDNQFGKIDNTNDGEIDNINGKIDNRNGLLDNKYGGKIDNINGKIDNRNGLLDNKYGGKIDNTEGIINNINGEIDNGKNLFISKTDVWLYAGTITGNQPVGAGTIT